MSARTEAGRPDCKKKVRAWSPMTNKKERKKERDFYTRDVDIYEYHNFQVISAPFWGTRSSEQTTTTDAKLSSFLPPNSFLGDSNYQMSFCSVILSLCSEKWI